MPYFPEFLGPFTDLLNLRIIKSADITEIRTLGIVSK